MRRDGDHLYYDTPEWRPFSVSALEHAALPSAAIDALAERGLPHNAYEVFIRDPERELAVAELPGCGPAAFLANYADDSNSYWISQGDGSIWMRWGGPDEPADNTQQINTSPQGLQGILAAWCDLKAAGLGENDGDAYEDAVNQTVIQAVSSDPPAFANEEGWWQNFLLELEFTLPSMLAGDNHLHQLVRRDESGRWVLDHPGYASIR